jgi:peptidoglycan/LPS O-acetylase OafA/YrhL
LINPALAFRIKFIDGLRAIAVIMVVLFHFYYQQISEAGVQQVEPLYLQDIFQYGNMGVYIFFVISGFIVSYVTYNRVRSLNYIANFIVKRQVRLDPPFWLTIMLGVFLAFLSVKVLHKEVYIPNIKDVFLNIVYLFDIFNRYDIIRVGWTLCLEIQFYLVFIVITYTLNRYIKSFRMRIGVYGFLFGLSILSFTFFHSVLAAFILNYWFVFFLGVSITLLLYNEISERLFLIILIVPYCALFTGAAMIPIYFSTATALLIFLAFKFGRENSWLSNRFFQFYGLISYSLYLTHCLIGNKLIRLLKSYLEWDAQSIETTVGILMLSFAISTIFAYLFYQVIEKRSIIWSKRMSSLIK